MNCGDCRKKSTVALEPRGGYLMSCMGRAVGSCLGALVDRDEVVGLVSCRKQETGILGGSQEKQESRKGRAKARVSAVAGVVPSDTVGREMCAITTM